MFVDRDDPRRCLPASRATCRRTATPAARRIGFLLGAAFVAFLSPSALEIARAEQSRPVEYRLGPEDKIRIRVLEWLPSRGNYQKWDALDGDYVVSQAGTVSIPLVGSVAAAGLSPDAVAERIGKAVQVRTELQAPPAVSVEVAEYRPVYVMGAVKTPGSYPWRPDLDVTKAIGLAGGRYRPFEGSPRFEREIISQAGLIAGLDLEITRTLARRARLAAEAADAAEIAFPPEVADDAANAAIMGEERAILASRRGALSRQLAAIDDLKSFLSTEIETLQGKVALQERQLDSARKELSSVAGLASRGLSPANRQFAMDRVLAGIETERLDLSTAIIRVRQNLATADRDKITLVETRQLEIARDRQEVQSQLEQLQAKLQTAERLIYEAGVTAPRVIADAMARRDFDVTYTITRRTEDGKAEGLSASRDTMVLPGDIVEIVEIAPAGTIDPGLAATARVSGRAPEGVAAALAAAPAGVPAAARLVPVPSPRDLRAPGEG